MITVVTSSQPSPNWPRRRVIWWGNGTDGAPNGGSYRFRWTGRDVVDPGPPPQTVYGDDITGAFDTDRVLPIAGVMTPVDYFEDDVPASGVPGMPDTNFPWEVTISVNGQPDHTAMVWVDFTAAEINLTEKMPPNGAALVGGPFVVVPTKADIDRLDAKIDAVDGGGTASPTAVWDAIVTPTIRTPEEQATARANLGAAGVDNTDYVTAYLTELGETPPQGHPTRADAALAEVGKDVAALRAAAGGGGGPITADLISDAGATGKASIRAATQAEGRAAIAAGTSDLTLGTTSDTAAAGNHTHPGYVTTSRTVATGTGLTGGGDLTADRILSVVYGTTSTTAARGDDARLSDARTPVAHTHVATDISNSTVIGRSLMTAATESSARASIGAAAVVQMTQAAYDALGTKDATTLYVIVG